MAKTIKEQPWWMVLIFLVSGMVAFMIAMSIGELPSFLFKGSWLGSVVPYFSAAAVLVFYVLVRKLFEGVWPADLKLGRDLRFLGIGILGGLAYFAVVTSVIAACGCYRIESLSFNAKELLCQLAMFFAVAVGEEVVFRGIIYRLVDQKFGMWVALVLSGLIFGFVHISNENATVWSSVAIAIEAGLLLAVVYKYTGSLWTAIGIHWSWNFVQGPVLGFAVSGISVDSVVKAVISGPELISGGAFGAEASIVATLVGLGASIWLVLRTDRKKAL